METVEARAALNTIQQVERTAKESSEQRAVSWCIKLTLAALAGVTMALLQIKSNWGWLAFALFIALSIAVAVVETRNRGTRVAVRQNVTANSKTSWKLIAVLMCFPFVQLLPDNSITWAVVAGVMTTALSVLAMWELNRNAA